MKKVKLLCVLLFFFFAFTQSEKVQAQLAFGGSLGTNIPIKDGQSAGFGVGLKGMYFVNPKFAVGLNINRLSYSGNIVNSSITGFTPFAHLFFSEEGFRPYIGIDAGIYRTTAAVLGISVNESNFGIAPTLGAFYDLNDNFALDFNLKYTLIFTEGSTGSSLPINVGVVYKLSK
jgi:opacity protein-like surface antigen